MDFSNSFSDMMTDPMCILVLIFAMIIILLSTVLFFFWYTGWFEAIDIKTMSSPFQEIEVAYKFVKGTDKDCSLVYAEAHNLIPECRCIGVYYDNNEMHIGPRKAIVGLIINESNHVVTDEEKRRLFTKGFNIATLPAVENIVYTEIPHMSFLSNLIAIYKVVPFFKGYVEAKKLHAHPLIQIVDESKIIYFAPLSKQSEFCVIEALEESDNEEDGEEPFSNEDSLEMRELEEIPDTISSIDSLLESDSRIEDLPLFEKEVDSSEKDKKDASTNGSDSTESFEELQLDS